MGVKAPLPSQPQIVRVFCAIKKKRLGDCACPICVLRMALMICRNFVLSCGLVTDILAVRKNLFLHKITKCTDPLGLAQLFGVGEVHGHFT